MKKFQLNSTKDSSEGVLDFSIYNSHEGGYSYNKKIALISLGDLPNEDNKEIQNSIEISGEKIERKGFFQRISDWFRNLFGVKKDPQPSKILNSGPKEGDLRCIPGEFFVWETKDDGVQKYEYYGVEKVKPVTGEEVEMCCAKTEDGKYKECSQMLFGPEGEVPTSADIQARFILSEGEYIKYFEVSSFMGNQCIYSFDDFGEVEVRSC
jgi:hypothetical protein